MQSIPGGTWDTISERMAVSILQYADDTCLVANSPSAAQELLHTVETWLSWSGMKAKVPKCHALALKASVGRVVDPHLSIDGQEIPFASAPVKFLGRTFQVPHDIGTVKENISSRLQKMLDAVDSSPLTRGQKIKLFRAGICPCLAWLLTIDDLPISWVEKRLDAMATLYVKKWVGLTRSANPTILYLPHKLGGLNLPLISVLFKRLQSLLLTSPDPCVRLMAEKGLQRELSLQRSKFKPSVVVREVMVSDSNFSRKSLSKRAKLVVEEESLDVRRNHLLSLEREGHMFRISSPDAAEVWGQVSDATSG